MSQQRRLNPYSPVPSLAAANQNQIEDLVQRNKTLDVTLKKLAEEAKQEQERLKAELLKIRDEQAQIEEEWRKSCHDMLGMCRISQKKVQLELEGERMRVIQEMRICREEKLERIKRDYKIKLFQMREEELEQQILQFEETRKAVELEHREQLGELTAKHDELNIKLRDALDELKQVQKGRDEMQAKYDKLAEEFAASHANNSTINTKLERLKLQLDGSHTKNSDLERVNDELKRTNVQLQRQINDWQNLEKREEDQIDTERKERIALSVELNKVEAQHKADVERYEATLAKERQKVEKWKGAVEQWRQTSNENESDLEGAQTQINKLQKLVDKLKADLETERSRVRPPSPSKALAASIILSEGTHNDNIPRVAGKKKASSSKVPSKQKGQGKTTSDDDDDPRPTKSAKPPRKAGTGKNKKKSVEPSGDEEEDEDFAIPQDLDSDDEDEAAISKKVQTPLPIGPPKGKRKRKEAEPEEDKAPGKRARPKGKNVAGKPTTTLSIDREDSEGPQGTKKRRKINLPNNIFPTNAAPFDFGTMTFGGTDGLDIPMILSPVREDDPVPPRSANVQRRSGLR